MRIRSLRPVLLGTVATLIAGVAMAAPVSAGGPDTWYVAPAAPTSAQVVGGSCATPDFNEIQTAVDAAGPFDTIVLCNGTYVTDGVRIAGWAKRGLTLKAKNRWKATLTPFTDSRGAALVEIANTKGITIQHLRLRGRPAGCASRPNAAIDVDGVKNVDIRGNRISSPPGAALEFCGLDDGITVNESTGTVRYNLIQDFGFYGILLQGNDDRGLIRVIGNSVRFRHAGVFGEESSRGTGIYVHDGELRTFQINNNKVMGLPTAGTEPTGTTPLLDDGIFLEGEIMTVLNNEVRHAYLGLFAYDHPNVGVRRNVALDNVQDCGSDQLTPRWVDNIGETSDPEGLCSAPN